LTGVISAVIIILVLGVLITVHEIGHFLAARICRVRVREFAIGMGPAFFKRQKKNAQGEPEGTIFSLRVFPIGGFCDMGEDEDCDDPSHFRNKNIWQKIFVLSSGAVMNLALGFIFLLIFSAMSVGRAVDYADPFISSVDEQCPYDFQAGDRLHKVNGYRMRSDLDVEIHFLTADGPVDFVLLRNGKEISLPGLVRVPFTGLDKDGNEVTAMRFGITIGYERRPVTWERVPLRGAEQTVNSVRLVWFSLGQLISGKAGVDELVGPVGLGGVVNDVINSPQATPFSVTIWLMWLSGFIAVNLALVNMMPIPALDGGRIVFLFISAFLMLVRKKPLNAKIEGYIHGVTMLLLFALMIFIFFNDIIRRMGL
jgi:regulator of sigma E protease